MNLICEQLLKTHNKTYTCTLYAYYAKGLTTKFLCTINIHTKKYHLITYLTFLLGLLFLFNIRRKLL